MLQEACRWLHQLVLHHVVKDSTNSEEAFRRHAQIRQSIIVHKDLLDDEGRHRLGQVGATLHDP